MNLKKMHAILNAREERSRMQQQLLKNGGVLVSYSLNIPGPVKNSVLYRYVFEKGERQIEECLEKAGMKAKKKILSSEAGDCGLWLLSLADPEKEGKKLAERIKSKAAEVKSLMTDLEEKENLGRLMDIDVLYLAPGMQQMEKISRTELGKARRTCLVCAQPAFQCIRSARHQVPEVLMKVVDRILEDEEIQSRILGFDSLDMNHRAQADGRVGEKNERPYAASEPDTGVSVKGSREKSEKAATPEAGNTGRKLALEALRALLYEVIVTPKPGLVDADNNGAHQDMDITTFFDSALAIAPYLLKCFEAGRENAEMAPEDMLPLLRPLGIEAERQMYVATGGVNTHKGAVFTMGAILVACGIIFGRAEKEGEAVKADEILDLAGRICSSMENGPEGLRREVMQGYPTLRKQALPILRSCRKSAQEEEKAETQAGAGTEAGAEIKTGAEVETGRFFMKDPHVLLNAASVRALLGIMSELEDANIVRRAGREKLEEVRKCITDILKKNPDDAQLLQAAAELDKQLIQENISPGGSADLLAAALFLTALEENK